MTKDVAKNSTRNMTEGRPLILLLQFALPLLLGNLLQQTYNMVDAAIVGRFLGAEALAAVGSSSSVQFLILGFCIGTCTGFGVPVAKCFGADHPQEMRNYIFNAMALTAGMAVILTGFCALLCPWILHLLSVPENIFENAYRYLLVIFLGMPFTLLYNLNSSILRAVGDSRTPFLFLAVSAILNIVLDLFCIIVLKWGCAGAAIATIASQALSGISCLIFIWKKVPVLKPRKENCRISGSLMGKLLAMGTPMGFQFSITAIGSMVMQSANNGLGSIYVSGFTAGARIKQLALCPFDSLSSAITVFCGQNLGARKPQRIKKGILEGIAVGVAYGFLIGQVLIFGGRTMTLLFVSAEETAVIDAAAKYLRYMGYFYWSLGILNVCRSSMQGLGFSGRAVFSGAAEMVARIAVSLGFVGTFGYTAICFADQAAWVAACVYLVPMTVHCVNKIMKHLEAGQSMI